MSKTLSSIKASSKNLGVGEGDPNGIITQQQRTFVEALARGESKASALALAGYSPATIRDTKFVARLSAKPKVVKLLAEERAKYAEQSRITRQDVIDGLKDAISMAKLINEPTAMISGWREIGKLCGYYEPTTHKVEVSVNGGLVLEKMNAMSDEELLDLISRGMSESITQELLESEDAVE